MGLTKANHLQRVQGAFFYELMPLLSSVLWVKQTLDTRSEDIYFLFKSAAGRVAWEMLLGVARREVLLYKENLFIPTAPGLELEESGLSCDAIRDWGVGSLSGGPGYGLSAG